MNELFVFCSEVETVLRALRSLCGLANRASPKDILANVERLLVSAQQK